MDNINIKLHELQKVILRKLTVVAAARFNDLLIAELESEHMNYHLKRLLDLGLVEKYEDRYALTDKGKDYSNLMDDDVEFIEKQPKTSVLLYAVRKNAAGEVEHLLSKRLRQPYFGKIGRLTGKVRFGETLAEAAARELYEESGLHAATIVLEGIYHKLRHREDGVYVQDALFYTFFVTDFTGDFIAKTAHQENLWLTAKQLAADSTLDPFEGLKLTERFEPETLNFIEENSVATGY
jgi:ADP-ribose pyrophosphatase YjhB (NUDIX family)